MTLYALLFDAKYDDIPVGDYTLGVFTSRDKAKALAGSIFGSLVWERDEHAEDSEAWDVCYQLETPLLLLDDEYEPPIEMVVDMLWVRPYEPNRLITSVNVFHQLTKPAPAGF